MRNILEHIAVMAMKIDRLEDRSYEQEWRTRNTDELVTKFIQLQLEATDAYHESCLDLIHQDGIGKYTLAEVESCRFMTPYQFNCLRASKREENSNN